MHTPHVQRAYHRVTGSVYDEMAGMGAYIHIYAHMYSYTFSYEHMSSFAVNIERTCPQLRTVISLLRNFPCSLPLSLLSLSPPSLPFRAGEDGGVNNAEICVSVPHSFNGPCFQDLGLPLTASKIKANILKSPFCSDVV
jgi:hypothetical protein